MEVVTIVFDEILHIHRNEASRTAPSHTIFSFMSNFEYTPYVTVGRQPSLRPGMCVRALLRRPGDWNSLVGWHDIGTDELAAPDPKWHLTRAIYSGSFSLIAIAIIIRTSPAFSIDQAFLLVCALSATGAIARSQYKSWRRDQADLRVLQQLKEGVMPNLSVEPTPDGAAHVRR